MAGVAAISGGNVAKTIAEMDHAYIQAALTGLLAAQPGRPDHKRICEEAISIGMRIAVSVKSERPRINRAVKK